MLVSSTGVDGEDGSPSGDPAGQGGSADARIDVGPNPPYSTARTMATGGNGGAASFGGTPGAGGDARASTKLTGRGEFVSAAAEAAGGRGGDGRTDPLSGLPSIGRRSGDASSTSLAKNLDPAGEAVASAVARGGDAGRFTVPDPNLSSDGGLANAEAVAEGKGRLRATATASAGQGAQPRSAIAAAQIKGGGVGGAAAIATRPAKGFTVVASADAEGAGDHRVRAETLSAFDTFGTVVRPANMRVTVGGGGLTRERPEVTGGAGVGISHTSRGADDSAVYTAMAEFHIDPSGFVEPRNIRLSLTSTIVGSLFAFETLRFIVSREGEPLLDRTFDEASDAAAYFRSQMLDLGPANTNVVGDLDLSFKWVADLGSSDGGFNVSATFTSVAALTVPEPSALALLAACGLAASRRVRRTV